MRKMSLGFSPCPNDTYIFDALVHQKIDHQYTFETRLEDVETLNQMAFEHSLQISKISIHAWFHVLDQYRLLNSGGALGRGCGPLVVQREKKKLQSGRIALPGLYTTASLLFKMAIPGDFEFVQMPFDQIMNAVTSGQVDAGVIIHESRFTYQRLGLQCLMDLGEWWESETGCLIPLGGIMVSNKVEPSVQGDIQSLIRQSIEYAEQYPQAAQGFIRENAQELEDEVLGSHIGLYVNELSKDFGEEGKIAIQTFYERSCQLQLLPKACRVKGDRLFV